MTTNNLTLAAAGLDDLPDIRRFLRGAAVALGIGEEAAADMVTAVNEAVNNSLLHGYRSESGYIRLVAERDDADFLVHCYDQAPPYDPTLVPPPALGTPLEERAPGGLGIHMMRQFVDELRYRLDDSGQNVLTLVKRNAHLEDE